MTVSRALTAQMKQQISIAAAAAGVSATPAKHVLCTVKPQFPTDNLSYEEHPNYCADFESLGEVVRQPGYSEHTLEFERLTLADFILLAELAMAGGKTPTGAGPYVWTHNAADDDDLAYLFAEVGVELGGSGSNFIKLLQDGQCEQLEIVIDSEKTYITATAKFRGDETTRTASFSTTESITHATTKMRTAWVQLFINDSAATIGTTEIECNRLMAKLTLNNGLSTVQTDCGPIHGRERRHMQLELRFILDGTSDDEYIDWESGTVRFVRLKATVPVTNEYWQMDVVGVYQSYSHGEAGPFQDITLMCKSQRDTTLGYSWQQVVSHADADALDYYNAA
jgi:hypothetical protein